MGLSLDTYLDLTPFQFAQAHHRFVERVEKEREWTELKDWQIARWQVWRTLCPPQDKKELSVKDILELPGDIADPTPVKESSRDRYEELKQRLEGKKQK